MADNPTPLERLAAQLRADHRQMVRRARQSVYLRLALLAVVVAYMMVIYVQFTAITPEAVTKAISDEAINHLPVLRDQSVAFAKDSLPKARQALRDAILDVPTYAGDQLVIMLDRETRKHLPEHERTIHAKLTERLHEHIAAAEKLGPKATDQQKADHIRRSMRAEFTGSLTAAADAIYLNYADEIRRLNAYFQRLATGAKLTEREQIEREMIQVWMALIKHRHGLTPAAGPDPGILPAPPAASPAPPERPRE